jgi:hypothetical protein
MIMENTLPRIVQDRDFTSVEFVFADEPVLVNVSRMLEKELINFNVVEQAALEAYVELMVKGI